MIVRGYKIFFCSTLIFLSGHVYSQNSTADSLKKNLAIQKEDTNKVNTLNLLARQFLDVSERDNNISDQYAVQASLLAEKLSFLKGKAYAFQTLGMKLEFRDKFDEARKKYDTAFQCYEKLGDKNGMADVYGSFASLYYGQQNIPEGLSYEYKSLKLYEQTKNEEGIAGVYLSLGSQSTREKDYDKAANYFAYALDKFSKLGYKDVVAVVYLSLARIDYSKGNYNEALKKDSIALVLMNETGQVFNKAGLLCEIGNAYERLGDKAFSDGKITLSKNTYEIVLKNYLSAAETYRSIKITEFVFTTYTQIGNVYIKLDQLDSANYYLRQSLNYYLSLAPDLKRTYFGPLEELYLALSKLDSARGNTAGMHEKYKMYVSYKDSNSTEERAKRLQQVKMQYEFDKKESAAKAEQGKKDAEAKLTRNLQYTAIVIVLLIAIFLFLNNRQKQKAKVKIEKAYAELKSTQQQLIQSEKMASLGELTAGIAHEIQNPLNFVNNFSEVNKELIGEMKGEIEKGNIGEVKVIADDIEANEEKINHHGKRADAIVKSMLQHSRTSSNKKESTDINALADEYLRLAYHGLRAKDNSFNATLQTDYDAGIHNINVIPQDIGRVVLNLINNAFYVVDEKKKQSAEGGYEPTVSVNTKKVGDKVLISVKDNGNGVPQKVLDKIFQPFFTTKPTGQGTGLGLSLSYDIIKAHGGELKVKTKEGDGSEFIIQLPTN